MIVVWRLIKKNKKGKKGKKGKEVYGAEFKRVFYQGEWYYRENMPKNGKAFEDLPDPVQSLAIVRTLQNLDYFGLPGFSF